MLGVSRRPKVGSPGPLPGLKGALRLLARKEGVSLLELTIALAIMGLLGAVVVGAMAQVLVIPNDLVLDLNTLGQTRSGSTFLGDDVRYSQAFALGQQTTYGSFESADFTASSPFVETATYLYDSGKQTLVHDLSVGGVTQEQLAIVSNLPRFESVSMSVEAGGVTATLNQTTQSALGFQTTTISFLQAPEAPGPTLPPPGQPIEINPPVTVTPTPTPIPIPPVAFCFGGGNSALRGSGNTVVGDGVVNGVLRLAGSNNSVSGEVRASGDLVVSGVGNTTGPVTTGGTAVCRMRLDPSSFQPFDFAFATDTKLKDVPGVWQNPRRRQLKPGVYFVNGTLTLDGSTISGQVTLIARRIVVKGSNLALTPRRHGVLMLALGGPDPEAIAVGGDRNSLGGVIYADTKDVSLSGSNGLYDGSLIARTGVGNFFGSKNRLSLNRTHFDAAARVSR